MDGKTCKTCKYAEPISPHITDMQAMFPGAYSKPRYECMKIRSTDEGKYQDRMESDAWLYLCDGGLITTDAFSCNQWEPKNQG